MSELEIKQAMQAYVIRKYAIATLENITIFGNVQGKVIAVKTLGGEVPYQDYAQAARDTLNKVE